MASVESASSRVASRTGIDGAIRCQLVTPEKTLLDRRVSFLAVPLFDGEIGIAPGHTPLVARLGTGELRIQDGEAVLRFFLDGGFLQVRDNEASILTKSATPAELIEISAARKALENAQAMAGSNAETAEEKRRAVERARSMVRIAERMSGR